MFVKLGIIAGVLVLGALIFSTDVENLFPTTSAAVTDSMKEDVYDISSRALDNAEKRIDESVDRIVDKTSSTVKTEISETSERVSSQISDVKDSSQRIIDEKLSDFNSLNFFQDILPDFFEIQP